MVGTQCCAAIPRQDIDTYKLSNEGGHPLGCLNDTWPFGWSQGPPTAPLYQPVPQPLFRWVTFPGSLASKKTG